MKTALLALAAAASLMGSAVADEVVLRNGAKFSGAVREEGDRVLIEMDFGSMSFKKVDVLSITRGEDVIRGFEERAAKASGNKELVEVASWARANGLGRRADDLLNRVLQIDPDHAEARKSLGYERFEGRWLIGDALLVARGLVLVDGKWIPKEEAQRVLERQESAKLEADRIDLERRIADQQHQQEMVRIALERERIEMEKRDAEYLRDIPAFARVGGYPVLNPAPLWSEAPVPAPMPAGSPVVPRNNGVVPAPRNLPLTPPTVLPISPPWHRPVLRSSQPRSHYEKEDEERRR